MKLCFGIRFRACLLLIALLLAVGELNQGIDDGLSSSHPSDPPHAAGPKHARSFARLNLENGREVEYVGMFSADGKYRASSKFSNFLQRMGIGPSPDTQQRDVPPKMLHSYGRVVESYEPPDHAVDLPETNPPLGNARDAVVTFAYGHRRVLQVPQRLTTDSMRRVILTDPSVPAVHILDPKRKTSFSILGGQGRRLQLPGGVAVDGDDNIYITDLARGIVLVYDQYGSFVRLIGIFHGENMYRRLTGIAIDRKAGHLYLADGPRHLVFMLDLQGNVLKRTGQQWKDGSTPGLKLRNDTGPRELNNPTEIAVGDHEVVVLDSGGTRVRILDLEFNLVGGFSVYLAPRQEADGLGIDKEGNVYVSYVSTSEIRAYNRDGKPLGSFGKAGFRMGEFNAPRGLWVDSTNRIYVADTQNARIQVFQLSDENENTECASQTSGAQSSSACSGQ